MAGTKKGASCRELFKKCDFRFSRWQIWRWELSGILCLVVHHQSDDGGNTHLWNVGLLQWGDTVLFPKRLSSSII
jgi:hypothetical protein